ncbi:hypothetical protein [Vallitalea guaymasensis]|uniref:hypothetical protein n=1 Tax=Vallitalea guaymasensis TaxID=1185412 RepID=UPI000DE22C33|nr:hypothetical protein [Vallitalea guaymasensis]
MEKKIIEVIQKHIDNFSTHEKIQLCEECHAKYGCNENHDVHMYDTGICSNCGKFTDVVNCSIARLVKAYGISELDYYRLDGSRLVYAEEIKEDNNLNMGKINKLKFNFPKLKKNI